jgi:phosphatidylglycerol:prolipoprotein diacylglycerol transferase
MSPIIVDFGPFALRWYGLMMALTILVSIWLASYWGPRFVVPRPVVDAMVFWVVVVLFVGARVGYVLSHPQDFREPLDVVRVWEGGLSSHGAIIAGLLYVLFMSRRTGISMWTLADTFAWPIPVGNIFVRFGNFMNGELYGDPTSLPWGVRFPTAPDGPRHPLQLYEMAIGLAVLALAWRVARHRAFPGQVWWAILVPTSIGRILLDLLRSEDRVWGIVTYGQIPAAILTLVGAWFLAAHPGLRPAAGPPR